MKHSDFSNNPNLSKMAPKFNPLETGMWDAFWYAAIFVEERWILTSVKPECSQGSLWPYQRLRHSLNASSGGWCDSLGYQGVYFCPQMHSQRTKELIRLLQTSPTMPARTDETNVTFRRDDPLLFVVWYSTFKAENHAGASRMIQ